MTTPKPGTNPVVDAHRRTQFVVVLVGLVVLVGVVIGSVKYLGSAGMSGIPLLGIVLAAAAALFLIPVEWLPATAIVLFAAVPDKLTPSEGIFGTVPPITVVIVIWVIRRVVLQQGKPAPSDTSRRVRGARAFALVGAALLVVWLLLSISGSQAVSTSTTWTICFISSALLVMVVPSAAEEARLLREAWIRTGFWFGLYAAAEVTLQSSPLYGPIYRALGAASVQHWSVYRAEVGFGHPIWAGAYFTPAAILGLVYWLQTGRTKYFVLGAGAAIGVVSTVTRGSIAAIGISIATAVVVVALFTKQRSIMRIVGSIVGSGLAAVTVLVASPLAERTQSAESAISTGARDTATGVGFQAAADSAFLGAGPGTSGLSSRVYSDVVIESSLLQLLISIGIPGLVLFLAVVSALVVNALRVQDVAAAMALVAYVIAISSFNSIDAIRSEHVLIGMLFLICLFPMTPVIKPSSPPQIMSTSFERRPTTSRFLATVSSAPRAP